MRDTDGSSVSATVRLSMLKPRPLNNPATRASTPNSFSTKIEMVWRIGSKRAAEHGAQDVLHEEHQRTDPESVRAGRSLRLAGSGASIAPQNLHDAVFARQFHLLNPLLLEILLRGEIMLVLQRREPFLELEVFLVIATQLRIPIDQRADHLFFVFLHAEAPRRVGRGLA